MLHCIKSWVRTFWQFVTPWLCSQWRTTFWVSSDGRTREDTSFRVRYLPVADQSDLCYSLCRIKPGPRHMIGWALHRSHAGILQDPYHNGLSQGPTPVWAVPPVGQRFSASARMSAAPPLLGQPSQHESTPLVSWGDRKKPSLHPTLRNKVLYWLLGSAVSWSDYLWNHHRQVYFNLIWQHL